MGREQAEVGFGDEGEKGKYSEKSLVNEIRSYIEAWRALPNPNAWGVTPATPTLADR